ncbi:hypothetical protein [Ruegeria atlantica]|uniref:hypothetical protein n=1 Tax=Ruegeria atlantica TaxID=81569 RepID=UPI002494CC92|nr:hypothetical protein [Ruegeria atlantica]
MVQSKLNASRAIRTALLGLDAPMAHASGYWTAMLITEQRVHYSMSDVSAHGTV